MECLLQVCAKRFIFIIKNKIRKSRVPERIFISLCHAARQTCRTCSALPSVSLRHDSREAHLHCRSLHCPQIGRHVLSYSPFQRRHWNRTLWTNIYGIAHARFCLSSKRIVRHLYHAPRPIELREELGIHALEMNASFSGNIPGEGERAFTLNVGLTS